VTSTEANKALIRRLFAEIDKGNLDVVDEIIDEAYVDHDPPPVPGIAPGREGLKQALKFYWRTMPGSHQIEDQIAEGDKVVTRMTNYGRRRRDLFGCRQNGTELRNTAIVIHRIAGGKVVEKWAERDMVSLFKQLGILTRATARPTDSRQPVGVD
jgi:predicted ester cyclase